MKKYDLQLETSILCEKYKCFSFSQHYDLIKFYKSDRTDFEVGIIIPPKNSSELWLSCWWKYQFDKSSDACLSKSGSNCLESFDNLISLLKNVSIL